MKRNYEESNGETIRKKQQLGADEYLDNSIARKVDNLAVHKKFGPVDQIKLKVFDQIFYICLLKYFKAAEREIENQELDCTNGVANNFYVSLICSGRKLKNFGENLG